MYWNSHIDSKTPSLFKQIFNYETELISYYGYAYAWFHYSIILWGESTNAEAHKYTLVLKKMNFYLNINFINIKTITI